MTQSRSAVVYPPGSAGRAFLAWRTTASAMLPLWVPLPFLTSVLVVPVTDGWIDLAFVAITVVCFLSAVLAVIPLFAFTVGRWLDRRTAPRGLGRSLIIFGLYGLGFGLFLTLLLGLTALTPLGIVVMIVVPTITAIAGRLLMELRGRFWYVFIWATFLLTTITAIALWGALFLSRMSV